MLGGLAFASESTSNVPDTLYYKVIEVDGTVSQEGTIPNMVNPNARYNLPTITLNNGAKLYIAKSSGAGFDIKYNTSVTLHYRFNCSAKHSYYLASEAETLMYSVFTGEGMPIAKVTCFNCI